MPDAAAEIVLVEKAILSGVGGCLEWIDEKTQRNIRSNAELRGLTAKAIKEILIEWVATKVHRMDRRKEQRPEYQDHREFWFRVLGSVPGLSRDLFIEMELTDDDV